MAFGFGFNKTKVLASAEKYIQQGKLQNAISEYEKVVKADPKDLTVLNTIGDLYARIGQTEKAVGYFKSVGETYAAQGFTVKAIAMYKKLTKLRPSVESVLKLADLYSQQGLQNDARAQYLLVAEQFLRSGQLEQTARIFQKVLEIDPENCNMQVRLADVYVRLERKDEARKLLLRAAETFHGRGAKKETEEVLLRVLELDPNNKQALLLRGNMALEAGNADLAIQSLEKISGLDAHPEGLRQLTQAYLQVGRTVEAGPLAKQLFALHQDASGISAYADALLKAGEYDEALRIYQQYADRLLTGDGAAGVLENLYGCLEHVKENAASLEVLRHIYERTADKFRLGEIAELEAKLCEQSGDLRKARDLYLQLTELEPSNPTNSENYNRLLVQLGSSNAREDGQKPVAIEDLNTTAPQLDQGHPEEVSAELRRALTDADLFASYNMCSKAIAALEAALTKAPNDAVLNRRLAALYAREARFANAAQCCERLQGLYSQGGFSEYAEKYAELSSKYRRQAVVEEPVPQMEHVTEAPAVETPVSETRAYEAPAPEAPTYSEAVVSPTLEAEQEIDISGEWEKAYSPEEASPLNTQQEQTTPSQVSSERLEEIQFYIQHGLLEEAQAAIVKCETEFPSRPELALLREQLAARLAPKEAPAQPTQRATAGTLGELAADLELALGENLGAPAVMHPEQASMAAAAGATGSSAATMSISPPVVEPIITPSADDVRGKATSSHGADSELAEIFSEFKEGLEEGGATQTEDPETHYNLGVAFKEMGLLDEAIGELQKVCQAVERGQSFTHVMQAFTWLAQCFLEKGVPQAAIRWYEKALKLPGIDEEARVALHYELASAFESANNKPAALTHFMEVYGSNIDYRDVAERIKALKS